MSQINMSPHPVAERIAVLGILALVIVGASVATWAESAPRRAESFEFATYNRSYSHQASDLQPYRQGPLTIRLQSPRNEVTLHAHKVVLRPEGGNVHWFLFEADFEGDGDLEAEIDASGAVSRLADTVIAPRQRVRVDGRIEMVAEDTAYRLRVLEVPPSVAIEIRSGIGDSLSAFCRPLGLLLNIDCSGIERVFQQANLPMPAAGEVYYLPYSSLTLEEKGRLDAYLARAAATTS